MKDKLVGLAAGLARYRPLFLGLAGLALAAGYYAAYRRRATCADGSCERGSGGRAARAGLWAVTALTVALASFPGWSARLLAGRAAPTPAGARALTLAVAGMHCAACAPGIEAALGKVPGVSAARVDFAGGTATVYAAPGVDAAALVKAVEAAGYKAQLREDARGTRRS